jgi:hypothetical protein
VADPRRRKGFRFREGRLEEAGAEFSLKSRKCGYRWKRFFGECS